MSHRPEACAVFQTVAQETDSERSEHEHEGIQDKIYQDTYVHFGPNIESDLTNPNSTDSNTKEEAHHWPQDEGLHLAEGAQSLEKHLTIDCVIGRVKIGKWWEIINRSIVPGLCGPHL